MKGAAIHSYPQPPAEDVSEAEGQERSQQGNGEERSMQAEDVPASSSPTSEG